MEMQVAHSPDKRTQESIDGSGNCGSDCDDGGSDGREQSRGRGDGDEDGRQRMNWWQRQREREKGREWKRRERGERESAE